MEDNLICNWNIVTQSLFDCNYFSDTQQKNVLKTAVEELCKQQMGSVLIGWFVQTLQENITSDLAPAFWKHFEKEISKEEAISTLCKAFNVLHDKVKGYLNCMEKLDIIQGYMERQITDDEMIQDPRILCPQTHLKLMLKAYVFFEANIYFLNSLNHLYVQAFKSFDASNKPNDIEEEEEEEEVEYLTCDGCDVEKEVCQCSQILTSFHHINSLLRELDLLECVSSEAVTLLIHQRIKQHIEHTCQGNFEVQYLPLLQEWLDTNVVGWLELLYGENNKDPSAITFKEAHKGRLYHYMYEVFAKVAISQLFDVIIEYPESEPALLDLKVCLEKINLRNELVTSLKNALETRLLHPGVNTQDILTAYISAIRSLRVLDPAGVLLDLVCEPVRSYLRNREDTVRCIVTSLTEDGNSELSDELIKAQPLVLDESYHSDEEGEDWESWEPDPVDADPQKSSSRRSSDIISMLVNIYGSKELFVTEYQTLLADRILTHFNYDTQKEIRYLELLKLRFGESQLHLCEVMLKDVADSKRLNANILEKKEKDKQAQENCTEDNEKEEITVSGMILSAQFWPTFREEKLQIPQSMQEALDKYTKSFEALKGNRTLIWRPHLGLVDIELELKDRILNLKVSPIHATIIWHFQEKNKWTIDELSTVMHMPAHALRRKIAFWQSHGLLKEESSDVFVLLEEQKGRHHDSTMVIEEEEAESAMASAQDLKEEEYQVIWQYVVGMLTNLESLPLERIHSMLKMFAMQGPGSEIAVHELKAFLDKKVKDQKLIFNSGVYRLTKSN